MMKILFPLLMSFWITSTAHAGRAVMEGISASNKTVFVDTVTQSVGIATATPKANLDVSGNAMFGAGTDRSTFTATPGGTVYALRLSSGVKLAAGCVGFSDNTIQCAAAAAASGTTVSSTQATWGGSISVTRTTPGPVDAAVSTLTVTFGSESRAMVCMSCNWTGGTTDQELKYGVLLDSALWPGMSDNSPLVYDQESGTSGHENVIAACSISGLLSAAEHTFAALWWTESSTLTVNPGGVNGSQRCSFSVLYGFN